LSRLNVAPGAARLRPNEPEGTSMNTNTHTSRQAPAFGRGTKRVAAPRRDRFQWILGALLAAIVAAVCLQQSPGWWRGKLEAAEVDSYISRASAQVPLPPEQKDEILKRLRAFGLADDGKPLYMLNVMRYFAQPKALPGVPAFKGSSSEANAKYEEGVMPLLLKVGGTATYAGDMHGRNIFGHAAAVDDWNRVLVIRYPSRRAFLELVADPAYAEQAPLKLMSIDLVLAPTEVDMVMPDLRLAVAAVALLAFVTVGWWRAGARHISPPVPPQQGDIR
jgi:uncharacterized protein (DUF1330 family)